MDEGEPPRRRLVRAPTRGDAAGRGMGQRLQTASDRTLSSQAWLQRQLKDPYVQKAKAEGWRSRAAFKLLEIDEKLHLLRRGQRVIDLGCAPGGWVQAAVQAGASSVVGVDLLPVTPIEGATLIEGDFTDDAMPQRLLDELGGAPDLVLSDMAPNTTGHRQTDHLQITALIELAADFAVANLTPGGAFLTKTFQGDSAGDTLSRLKAAFAEVRYIKPKASRADSSEVYLAAMGLKPTAGRRPPA